MLCTTTIAKMEYFPANEKLRSSVQQRRMLGGSQRTANTKTVMSKTTVLTGIKSPIQEKIDAVQQKIKLLEYDQKAYQEITSSSMKETQETIKLLEKGNKKLNRQLTQEKQKEAKTGPHMIKLKEGKLHDSINHHNALSHQVRVHEKYLEELESRLKHNATVKQNKIPQEEQTQRLLENKLKEAEQKLQDVEYINRSYSKMTTHLQEEMPSFQPQIQQLEMEILLYGKEIKDLKVMKQNAVKSCKKAWAEYKHLKKEYRNKRSHREQSLRVLAHEAKERRRHGTEEHKEKEVKGADIKTDEDSLGEAIIDAYEEALKNIMETTGAVHTGEVLERFILQGERRKYLEREKLNAEASLSALKERQEKINNISHEVKYTQQATFEAQLSNDQRLIEDLRTQLQQEMKKLDILKREVENKIKFLDKATSEVVGLALRLKVSKVTGTNFSEISLDLQAGELLTTIGQKLQNLQKQIEGYGFEEISRKMDNPTIQDFIERNLPASNMRITLKSDEADDKTSDDEDDEEDSDLLTREDVKRISEDIIRANRRANIWCEKWVMK
ncbi:outer dynein arm-docking complex subunit 3-like [Engystomops pustulosus]|uniref:outer dynein arm-docking complex subunit 3-like n=1 Tax=Engystomops pustulosus TaxID=76066 RepID=UPI003AFB0EF3